MEYNLFLDLGISTLLCLFGYFVGWKECVKPAFQSCGLLKEDKIK